MGERPPGRRAYEYAPTLLCSLSAVLISGSLIAAPAHADAQFLSCIFVQANKIKRGFDIAPVPLDLEGKNRKLVGLGSYIVNAQGGCNDCHTNPPYAPGGDPFKGEPEQINVEGYLAGGQAFGPFISRNLTPCEDGEPEWTFENSSRSCAPALTWKMMNTRPPTPRCCK